MKQSFWFTGLHYDILADYYTTSGRYDLIERHFAPSVFSPWHLHTGYFEQLYVLQGTLEVHTKETTFTLKAGDSFLIPINTPHSVGAGAMPTRALVVASPSRLAHLIRTLGTALVDATAPPTTPPDIELLMRLSAEAGDVMLDPSTLLPIATTTC